MIFSPQSLVPVSHALRGPAGAGKILSRSFAERLGATSLDFHFLNSFIDGNGHLSRVCFVIAENLLQGSPGANIGHIPPIYVLDNGKLKMAS